ncbi:uncharacterized protein [Ptychodera flava]|uniref:uncharacterized protein n=1 Tax=Ptychodera flava TaxID=63121 RepID=UPI00396A39BE
MGFVSLISCYFTLLYYRTVRRHWPEQQDARTVRLHELLTDRDVGVQPLPGNAAVKPRVRTVYLHVFRKDRHGASVDTASQPLSTTCEQPTESYRPTPPPQHPLMFLKAVPKKVDQSRFPKAEEAPAVSEIHMECPTQGADLAELEPFPTLEECKCTDQTQDDTEHASNNVATEEMVPSVDFSGKYHDIENVLEVDSKLETSPGILEDEISSSSVGAFFTPVYGIFIYIAMLVTMVMAFLLHNRIYDNFLELNLDEQHVADVLCIASVYSLLQFCSVGITYCIAMTITNFERHQHQRQYDHSLHAKQVVLIVVGIFSPISLSWEKQ